MQYLNLKQTIWSFARSKLVGGLLECLFISWSPWPCLPEPGLEASPCSFYSPLCLLLLSCVLLPSSLQVICTLVAAFLHFFFLSSFCWVLTEAWQSYMAVTGRLRNRIIRKRFLCLGWGEDPGSVGHLPRVGGETVSSPRIRGHKRDWCSVEDLSEVACNTFEGVKRVWDG